MSRIVDCDVHCELPSAAHIKKYLPTKWQNHYELFGLRRFQGGHYLSMSPHSARRDSLPPGGGIPGSDRDFLAKQLLDEYGISLAILNPISIGAAVQLNKSFGAALATALNDWLVEEWLSQDARFRASIIVPYEDHEASVKEIESRAKDPRFVQVLFRVRTAELLGNKRYYPIYEAASSLDLPIAIHFGGFSGYPVASGAWPSFYIEEHSGNSLSFESQVISLVCNGTFERFKNLKIVLVEGGFAWLCSLLWGLRAMESTLRKEIGIDTYDTELAIRNNFWITTQPMEETPSASHLLQTLSWLDMDDKFLFASDYPHWDFDSPKTSIPKFLPKNLRDQIFYKNAVQLYNLSLSL